MGAGSAVYLVWMIGFWAAAKNGTNPKNRANFFFMI